MPSLFDRLIGSNDRSADSIVLTGMAMGVALCAICAWDVVFNGREFAPLAFGGGAAAILGGIGGGKTLRDKIGKPKEPGDTR